MTVPLVPSDLDLRDFAFMPLDIGRLFGSEFHAQSDDGAWRAGVTLWLKSYHQVPAASIPDDDVALARLAELGRDVKGWRKIKDAALRGWVKCDDGRLYHPVVAEKALEGWIEKLGQRKASAAGNAKRYNQAFDPAAFDEAIDDAVGRLAALNPASRLLARRIPKASKTPPDGSPVNLPSGSQGTGKGRDREESEEGASAPFDRFWEKYPHKVAEARSREAFEPVAHEIEAILLGVDIYVSTKPNDREWLNPATFLTDGRWRDRPAAAPTNGRTPPGGGKFTLAEAAALDRDRAWRAANPRAAP